MRASAGPTRVEVVRVFTDTAGNLGNALGIARADDVGGTDQQALATRAGFSETVVVDAPIDAAAKVRIFTPAVELPFAGHPSVGTAWWFAQHGTPVQVLDVPAGPVAVEQLNGVTWITARAEWTPTFTFHQLADLNELAAMTPDEFPGGPHYLWVWTNQRRGGIRARMFAPTLGITEDEATGAAAIALTAKLRRSLIITQGVGSQLFTEWDSNGWVRLGGRVVADSVVDV